MFISTYWMGKANIPKAEKIQALLEAFVHHGRAPKDMPDPCCVWMDDGGNLWFKSAKYKKPTLLAVWGRDDVINVRVSDSEQSHHGDHGYSWVSRVSLRQEIEQLARRAGHKADHVRMLSPRKAEEAMFNRLTKGI